MSKVKWPYQFKVQNKNMTQQTEISFPLVQIQTFNADKKKKKSIHPGKKPPEALKKKLTLRKYSEPEKVKSFHIRLSSEHYLLKEKKN